MSYTYLLMVLCECACANLISKANFNLLDRTDLFIRLHIMFQISFQSSKGQKSYHKFLGVRSELLLSIFWIETSFNKLHLSPILLQRDYPDTTKMAAEFRDANT